MDQIKNVPLEKLEASPYQGRLVRKETKPGKSDDPAMKKLMESIEQNGLMTPIIVRKKEGGRYEIIDGHRRVEAIKRHGKTEVTAIVKDYDDKKAQVFSVVGNLMRKNLSLIEKALAFKKILKANNLTQLELAQAIGTNESFMSDILNTLDMDQRIIKDLVGTRTTDDVRLLRAIRKVEKAVDNTSDKQWNLYEKFKAENLTRKQVIDAVKSGRVAVSPVRIEGSNKVFSIHLSKAVTDEQKEELREVLTNKIGEWQTNN